MALDADLVTLTPIVIQPMTDDVSFPNIVKMEKIEEEQKTVQPGPSTAEYSQENIHSRTDESVTINTEPLSGIFSTDIHSKGSNKTYHCPMCHYENTDIHEWEQHRWKCHGIPIPNDKTETAENREQINFTLSENVGSFSSFTQGYNFVQIQAMDYQGNVTLDKTICKCDSCDKLFLKEEDIVEHRKVHSLNSLHECEICQKKFIWRDNLLQHRKFHSLNHLHQCEICQKSFLWKTNLVQHRETHHTKTSSSHLATLDHSETDTANHNKKFSSHVNTLDHSQTDTAKHNKKFFSHLATLDCSQTDAAQQKSNCFSPKPCKDNCKFNCTSALSKERRQVIWQEFLNKNRKQRKEFILQNVSKIAKERGCDGSRRQFTFEYFLITATGVKTRVCKTVFLTTLGKKDTNHSAICLAFRDDKID